MILRVACTLLLLTGFAASAQDQPKLSPLTRIYLEHIRNHPVAPGSHEDGYVYRKDAAGNLYLSGIVKVKDGCNEAAVKDMGVLIGTKAGNIWTVQVPVDKVIAFTQISGIAYIQLDEPANPCLNAARTMTRVDSVHKGINLPMAYHGEGVVAGIVDAGFDYGHPTFYDTTGTNYRIKQVWEQQTIGTPPTGFVYGNEMTDPVAILAAGTDNNTTPHGTHVAGITAGSGLGGDVTTGLYRGFADKADIVMVGITPPQSQWMNTGCSDMIDGISYIFNYAVTHSQPAVVNLSWGSPLGPRDGSGLFSQALDALVGPGKIFVCSAGNNGEDSIHIAKTFTAADTQVNTFLRIAENPLGFTTWVDAWGDTDKIFCAAVTLYDSSFNKVDSTGFVCLDDALHHYALIGSNGDTCFIDVTTSAAEFNDKPRIFFAFDSRVNDHIVISLKGTDGSINMWNSYVYQTTGYYGAFTNEGQSWAANGNTDMTISDIAATRNAITVGAYASKVSWTNLDGGTYSYGGYVALKNRVPFSSHGPTADGRIKPDIMAPGMTLASAISSYDTAFAAGGTEALYDVATWHSPVDSRDYVFGVLSGTSMASPCVSGAVALMLQANPNLDPDSIKSILAATAITGAPYVGTLPPEGTVLWGHGKLNAYRAVLAAVTAAGIENSLTHLNGARVYPDPSSGAFTVGYTASKRETCAVSVADMTGRVVLTHSFEALPGYNASNLQMNVSGGLYFIHMQSPTGSAVMKLFIIK